MDIKNVKNRIFLFETAFLELFLTFWNKKEEKTILLFLISILGTIFKINPFHLPDDG
jgi:hypothetical protein